MKKALVILMIALSMVNVAVAGRNSGDKSGSAPEIVKASDYRLPYASIASSGKIYITWLGYYSFNKKPTNKEADEAISAYWEAHRSGTWKTVDVTAYDEPVQTSKGVWTFTAIIYTEQNEKKMSRTCSYSTKMPRRDSWHLS